MVPQREEIISHFVVAESTLVSPGKFVVFVGRSNPSFPLCSLGHYVFMNYFSVYPLFIAIK
jgi:hypothetical protein